METESYPRDTASQDAVGSPPLLAYPLTRGGLELWLRRGEQLGQAACWIAATTAAGLKRAAKWRRHQAGKGPGHPPPAPV